MMRSIIHSIYYCQYYCRWCRHGRFGQGLAVFGPPCTSPRRSCSHASLP